MFKSLFDRISSFQIFIFGLALCSGFILGETMSDFLGEFFKQWYFWIGGGIFLIYNLLGVVFYYYDFVCRLRSKETFLRSKEGQFRWWFEGETQHWFGIMLLSFLWPLSIAILVLVIIARFAVRLHKNFLCFLIKRNEAHVVTHPDEKIRSLIKKS